MVVVRGLVLLVSLVVLVKTTELVVEGLKELSTRIRIGKFGLAVLILALSTSLPELMVGITAALGGQPSLSLGNVLGSNIANISLITGIASVVGGSIPVVGGYLKKDFIYAFLAGALPLFLVAVGSLSRVDGLVLIFVYGYYLVGVFKKRHLKTVHADAQMVGAKLLSNLRLLGRVSSRKPEAKVLAGVAVMLLAADLVVKMAGGLASDFGLPVLLVGLVLVAVGTSLPELVTAIAAIRQREVALVFGNLLGSTVANSTLIIGLTVLISPIQIQAFDSYLIASIAYGVVFLVFWGLSKSKRRLDRWEGGLLILIYLVFVAAEFVRVNGFSRVLQR